MKKATKHTYTYSLIAAIVLLIGGCGDFLNVNQDLTRKTAVDTRLVLTNAQVSLSFYQGSDVFLYSSIFMQQATGNGVAGNQTRFFDQYILTNTDVNNAW